MDIQMPEMDGLEAIQRIRRDPQIKDISIIAITSLSVPGDRERCLESGADDYLIKPLNLKNLSENIASHIKAASQKLIIH
jgi:CheY-like chemotaxis protein